MHACIPTRGHDFHPCACMRAVSHVQVVPLVHEHSCVHACIPIHAGTLVHACLHAHSIRADAQVHNRVLVPNEALFARSLHVLCLPASFITLASSNMPAYTTRGQARPMYALKQACKHACAQAGTPQASTCLTQAFLALHLPSCLNTWKHDPRVFTHAYHQAYTHSSCLGVCVPSRLTSSS